MWMSPKTQLAFSFFIIACGRAKSAAIHSEVLYRNKGQIRGKESVISDETNTSQLYYMSKPTKKKSSTSPSAFFQALVSSKYNRKGDLECQRQALYESQSQKYVGVHGRESKQERINESNTDNVIKVFFYSFSCYIISAVLTSCQGLWLLDNCVHFSHRADSKGLLFSNNTIFLSREYRCSHAHYIHTHTHTLRFYCIMIPHTLLSFSHAHVHKHINRVACGHTRSIHLCMAHIHTQPQDQSKYPRLFRFCIATTKHKNSLTCRLLSGHTAVTHVVLLLCLHIIK